MCRETVIIPDGYPLYRRRGRFQATLPDGRIITDNWVVPHNPYLLKRYRAHCNVEVITRHTSPCLHIARRTSYVTRRTSHTTNHTSHVTQVCAHFRCFKYVYKYTFKPPDHTAVCIDEINAHLSGRLLTVSEAVHRLLSLKLHDEWPSVVRLDIHLPHQQRMVFDPTADEAALLEQLTTTTSTLMGWFAINADDTHARSFLYHDIPEHYTWKDSRWCRRIYNGVRPVGRVYGVSHQNSELFAMRRLLSVVKGATCFEDVATVGGIVHSTFRAACLARGMMADDEELVAALREIIETTVSVSMIRRQFARIIVHSCPADPQALFNMFVDDLCNAADGDAAVNVALLAIEHDMNDMGRSLTEADFGFVLPDNFPQRRRDGIIRTMSREEAIRIRDEILPLFTHEQRDALQAILASVRSNDRCRVFALIASAGVGKTVFANGLAASLRADNKTVVCVAASALAAGLLSEGRTAHSAFHIPIPANEQSMCNLSHEDRVMLHGVGLIIYDECSMVITII